MQPVQQDVDAILIPEIVSSLSRGGIPLDGSEEVLEAVTALSTDTAAGSFYALSDPSRAADHSRIVPLGHNNLHFLLSLGILHPPAD